MSWLLAAKAVGTKMLGLLGFLPKQAWYVLGVLAFLGYFAHWNAERGRVEVRLQVEQAVRAERERLEESDRSAIEAADERARIAEALADARWRELQNVLVDAAHSATADQVCIPAELADGLRDLSRGL